MRLHFPTQLTGITKPPVWRKLTIPAQFSFLKFHQIIQAAFGWQDAHLFLFSPGGFSSSPWIKMPDAGDKYADVLNVQKMKLQDIFPANHQYSCIYHSFGDDWQHQIKLLRISEGTAKHATLTAGKGIA